MYVCVLMRTRDMAAVRSTGDGGFVETKERHTHTHFNATPGSPGERQMAEGKLEEVVYSEGKLKSAVNKLDADASKFRVSVQTDLQALKRDMQAVMGALKIDPVMALTMNRHVSYSSIIL